MKQDKKVKFGQAAETPDLGWSIFTLKTYILLNM